MHERTSPAQELGGLAVATRVGTQAPEPLLQRGQCRNRHGSAIPRAFSLSHECEQDANKHDEKLAYNPTAKKFYNSSMFQNSKEFT